MFGWLRRCWGGMGVITQLEKARIQCTFADWSRPDAVSMNYLMKCFRGENYETNGEAAINSLISHLEHDDQKSSAAFLLKNLMILDFIVEERIFLTKISNYYNSQLLSLSGGGWEMSSYVKDLICSFYIYVKEKAKLYSTQSVELANKNTRKEYIQCCTVKKILFQLNICFKIQALILDVSDKFNRGNKSAELIQMIFSCLLKTYLFCYSIVSMSLKVFFKRIPNLNRHDLEYLQKLTEYINKEYTRNFLLFIQRNKMIPCFKQIKYNELIILDEKVTELITEQLRMLTEEENKGVQIDFQCPKSMQELKTSQYHLEIQILKHQKSICQSEDSTHKILRKDFLVELRQSGQGDEHYFLDFQNFYSQNFEVQDSQNKDVSLSNFGSAIKPNSYKGLMKPKMSKSYMQGQRKFDRSGWQKWENIFSSQM